MAALPPVRADRLFGTASVRAKVWLVALALAALMGRLEEARKAWLRRSLE